MPKPAAWAAWRSDQEKETIIGVGWFALLDASTGWRSAELTFTVEEDFHGHGIAGCLLERLSCLAREIGISLFEAEIIAGNRAMLAVFVRSGLPMKQSINGGVVHVVLSLGGRATSVYRLKVCKDTPILVLPLIPEKYCTFLQATLKRSITGKLIQN